MAKTDNPHEQMVQKMDHWFEKAGEGIDEAVEALLRGIVEGSSIPEPTLHREFVEILRGPLRAAMDKFVIEFTTTEAVPLLLQFATEKIFQKHMEIQKENDDVG